MQLIVGDLLHDLRSSLEHIAFQLVKLDGKYPTENTVFPVREVPFTKAGTLTPTNLTPGITRRDILDAVEAVQPYNPQLSQIPVAPTTPMVDSHLNHLWVVNKLWNIDKHRLLLVLVCALDVDSIWFGMDGPPPRMAINARPLKDDDPVAWFDFGENDPPPDFDPHPAVQVFLRERDVRHLSLTPIVDLAEAWIGWIEWSVIDYAIVPLFS